MWKTPKKANLKKIAEIIGFATKIQEKINSDIQYDGRKNFLS